MTRILPARLLAPATAIVAVVVAVSLIGTGPASRTSGSEYYGCGSVRVEGQSLTSGAGGLMTGLTLDQLTDEADLVVVGTVESLQTCRSHGPVTIMTLVTISSGDQIKGDAAPRVTVAVPGGAIDNLRLAVASSPEFTVGERVVTFLGATEGGDLFPSSGFAGKFTVSDSGRITNPAITLGDMRSAVDRAARGDLPPRDDPLANGPQMIESSFVELGPQFADSAIPVRYYINPNNNRPAQLTAQDTRLASIHAFHSWQNLPGSYIAFGPVTDTTRASAQGDCDGNHDTTWGISNPGHSANTLAVTYTCYSGSTTLDTDVEIDTDHFGSKWRVDGSGACGSGLIDLETVLLHENGHVLGLGHPSNLSCNPCPIMDASYGGVNRTPCADDEAGTESIYPLSVGSPPAAPLLFTAIGGTSTLLTWADVANEWGYEMWRANEACSTAVDGDFFLLDTVQDGTISYTDTDYTNGLPNGTYCYKAQSFNKSGVSGFSATSEASIGVALTDTPSPTPIPTPTPSPTPTPVPTATPSPTPTAPPTPTASPVVTTPGITQSPPPAPTNTPVPTPSPTATPSPTGDAHIKGDVDCDDQVTTVDLLSILIGIGAGGFGAACATSADVNCDSVVNTFDALLILRHIANASSPITSCPPVGAAFS